MKHILQIVADGSPGGGTSLVLALCQRLDSQGLEVAFISQKDSYSVKCAAEFGLKSYGIDFFSSRLDPRTPFRLKKLIREIKPDLVHLHASRAGLPYTFSRIHDIPTVYTVHGYHFPNKKWPSKQLAILAEKRISSKMDVTVFVAEADREIARQYGILINCPRTKVIHNGLDISAVPPKKTTKSRQIAFLSRLCYQKDPLLFLEIMKILSKHNYTAVMIGAGEMEAEVRQRIAELSLEKVVVLKGSLPHQEALESIAEAEVMVMTSRWEGLPFAPIEAMCMGIPVIAPAVNGIPEIIQHPENGLLIYDRDPQSFVDAVLKLSKDDELRDRVITNARSTAEKNFSLDRVIQEHIEMYNSLLF